MLPGIWHLWPRRGGVIVDCPSWSGHADVRRLAAERVPGRRTAGSGLTIVAAPAWAVLLIAAVAPLFAADARSSIAWCCAADGARASRGYQPSRVAGPLRAPRGPRGDHAHALAPAGKGAASKTNCSTSSPTASSSTAARTRGLEVHGSRIVVRHRSEVTGCSLQSMGYTALVTARLTAFGFAMNPDRLTMVLSSGHRCSCWPRAGHAGVFVPSRRRDRRAGRLVSADVLGGHGLLPLAGNRAHVPGRSWWWPSRAPCRGTARSGRSTPWAAASCSSIPKSQEVLPDSDHRRGNSQELVGQVGRAKSLMLPSGRPEIGGRTMDAVSEGVAIEPGQMVRMVMRSAATVSSCVPPGTKRPRRAATPRRPTTSWPGPSTSIGLDPFEDPIA